MRSMDIYGDWLAHNGKTVLLNGLQHTVKVSTFHVHYPYEQEMIDVVADPVSKASKHYRDTKAKLGDDWVVDVLDSDEAYLEVLTQCLEQDNQHPYQKDDHWR